MRSRLPKRLGQVVGVAGQLGQHALLRRVGWPIAAPISLTVCLSHRCNARCQTCRIWQQPVAQELSRAEWIRALAKVGRGPVWFTFTGGEPFLNDDLVPIVQAVITHNQPSAINIPTNGALPDRILEHTQAILAFAGDVELMVNFSLDGVGPEHDRLRGLPGGFAALQQAFGALTGLKADHPNLHLGINTVFSRHNIDSAAAIRECVRELQPDSYVAELADERAELHNLGLDLAPEARAGVQALNRAFDLLPAGARTGLPVLVQRMRRRYGRYVEKSLATRAALMPCYAGIASAYLDPRGVVWPCCRLVPGPLGALRDFDFDLGALLRSPMAQATREQIKTTGCHCQNPNNFYTNALLSPLATLFEWR